MARVLVGAGKNSNTAVAPLKPLVKGLQPMALDCVAILDFTESMAELKKIRHLAMEVRRCFAVSLQNKICKLLL